MNTEAGVATAAALVSRASVDSASVSFPAERLGTAMRSPAETHLESPRGWGVGGGVSIKFLLICKM